MCIRDRYRRNQVIELDEFRATMASYRDPLGEVKSSLDIENKTDRIAKPVSYTHLCRALTI